MTSSSANAIDSFSTYDRAEFYHDHSLQQWSVAYAALKNYFFLGDEKVLEIGCRGGRVSANVAGRIPQGEIIATEMRGPGAIQFANQNHAKSLYPNLTFLEEDFLDSHYDNQFDLAVSFSSLHWYSD
jgi:trans-aconitate 2-methyltransferase